jgi:hypothetical protein
VNRIDPLGLWDLPTHRSLAQQAGLHTLVKLHGSFRNDKGQYNLGKVKTFAAGLVSGSVYPDIPVADEPLMVDPGTGVAWAGESSVNILRTHYGSTVWHHGMARSEDTPTDLQAKIANRIADLANQGYQKLHAGELEEAGNLLGQALHTLQDTYCQSHVYRDPETGEIMQFQDYSAQEKKKHARADVGMDPANADAYARALAASKALLQKLAEEGEVTADLVKEEFLKLKQGATAGGTRSEYGPTPEAESEEETEATE